MRELAAFLVVPFWAAALTACSSEPITTRPVLQALPETLRVRRPEGPGADPRVGPGGPDYTSSPLPNERMDCETPSQLFSGMDLSAIRSCLAGIKKRTVSYRVRRLAMPVLELLEPDKAPECVARLMASIPMPREILFQSVEEGHLDCYSSRLDIEADEVLGAKVPKARVDVRVDLPLSQLPRDDGAVARVLSGWVLTPFWNLPTGDSGAVSARVVPARMCLRCLGKDREDPNEAFDTHPGSWP